MVKYPISIDLIRDCVTPNLGIINCIYSHNFNIKLSLYYYFG